MNPKQVDIKLCDWVITPKSCCTLVTQLIKYIIYQRQIIPDPLETLKFYISKRKDLDSSTIDENPKSILTCLPSEKYFKKLTDTVNIIDSILISISQEIMKTEVDLTEVILLVGSTPIHPQDVFRIKIPTLTRGHSETHHSTNKTLYNLMKNVFTNEILNQLFLKKSSKSMSTNVYIMLKIKSINNDHIDDDIENIKQQYENDDYIQKEFFNIPSKCNHIEFTFKTQKLSEDGEEDYSCKCIIPFEDSPFINYKKINKIKLNKENKNKINLFDISSSQQNDNDDIDNEDDDFTWYQNKLILKSFREIEIKGKSVVNYWINPSSYTV